MVLLIAVFVFLVAIIVRHIWRQKLLIDLLPPGPKPLPLIGNLLQFDRKDPRKSLLKWHKKYGPMYTVWMGPTPEVFITGYQLMCDTFVKKGDEFYDRPKNWVFEYYNGGNYGLINASGEQMKEQRRFTLKILRNFGVGRKTMEDRVTSQTESLLRVIEKDFHGADRKVMSIQHHLDLCVANIMSSLLVGQVYEKDDSTYIQLMSILDKNFETLGFTIFVLNKYPWLRHIPLFNHFGFDDIKKQRTDFFKIIQDQFEKHKKGLDEFAEPDDFTASYLQEIRKRKENCQEMDGFSEWQLVSIISDLCAAGMETTITTMGWSILLMMRYPEAQKKVQEELDQVLGRERFPMWADRNRLPYTHASLYECQRYANITPGNLGRIAAHEIVVNGTTIPAGTTFVPQIAVAHMDESLFKNAHEFNPERFLDDGKSLKNVPELLPYSLGKRGCLGESLARMELFIMFSCLLHKFTFSTVPNELLPSLDPVMKFTLVAEPYQCLVTKRF